MNVPTKNAMLLRRILLWPFTLLYGFALVVRHALYDAAFLKRTRPSVPTIAIGNLALGGTGKTPMLEAILRILAEISPVATLSRGYGRTGNDIHEVHVEDLALQSGDEPVQIKRKFPLVRVFVGADRVRAIDRIQREVPDAKVVVLDDAFQHRRLDAGLNILLTTWKHPYCDDALLPTGRLRDLRSRAKAAEVVVVTKCPRTPSASEQVEWRGRLGLNERQRLFFAGIEYVPLLTMGRPDGPAADRETLQDPRGDIGATGGPDVLLFTGIADPAPLVTHMKSMAEKLEHIAFADHHAFTRADLQRLADRYANFAAGPKMLVTTEKDAARLSSSIAGSSLEGLPLAVIGMRTVILNEPERFAELIHRHVETHPAHR
ncbi:MAG TPA: tetraacyldisaccharide 4'-kinase [Flavobacteriales bacterium]|jgi:tetraacyldisaccharide 4'-kinase|nr:tetraacyldisaccharide 4'-kinase [Flavobacteriales bacterium]MBK7101940.1 tetraacyldisaccharide 4'-kinase [Flavobacteriales bacterium]MBK7114292.1 tetraacyldisaccharide 4'-kinase [Flavobacteriales bacterium]MBK7621022.1 tetraacyldisaccharide 4'-kinase [Flavobacteriales bacterium]MBK8531675.1 tetraacyldisaccharide 4'-kinase [Flavobacteriales bacterium]